MHIADYIIMIMDNCKPWKLLYSDDTTKLVKPILKGSQSKGNQVLYVDLPDLDTTIPTPLVVTYAGPCDKNASGCGLKISLVLMHFEVWCQL